MWDEGPPPPGPGGPGSPGRRGHRLRGASWALARPPVPTSRSSPPGVGQGRPRGKARRATVASLGRAEQRHRGASAQHRPERARARGSPTRLNMSLLSSSLMSLRELRVGKYSDLPSTAVPTNSLLGPRSCSTMTPAIESGS